MDTWIVLAATIRSTPACRHVDDDVHSLDCPSYLVKIGDVGDEMVLFRQRDVACIHDALR